MRVAIACDHAGFALKATVARVVAQLGHEVLNLGTDSADVSVDFPDLVEALGEALQREEADRGILICGSGVGTSIAANKTHTVSSPTRMSLIPCVTASPASPTSCARQAVAKPAPTTPHRTALQKRLFVRMCPSPLSRPPRTAQDAAHALAPKVPRR